jgi:hypothetical protein
MTGNKFRPEPAGKEPKAKKDGRVPNEKECSVEKKPIIPPPPQKNKSD